MSHKQPNSKHCFVCGVENNFGLRLNFYDTAPGRVEADWTVTDHFQGFPGIVHGGILASVLDEAATRTVFGADGSTRMVVTASLEVRYRKPVPLNHPLRVIGLLKEDKGEIIRAESRIEDSDGNVLTSAVVVLVEAPVDLANRITLSADEWKVYADGENQ